MAKNFLKMFIHSLRRPRHECNNCVTIPVGHPRGEQCAPQFVYEEGIIQNRIQQLHHTIRLGRCIRLFSNTCLFHWLTDVINRRFSNGSASSITPRTSTLNDKDEEKVKKRTKWVQNLIKFDATDRFGVAIT